MGNERVIKIYDVARANGHFENSHETTIAAAAARFRVRIDDLTWFRRLTPYAQQKLFRGVMYGLPNGSVTNNPMRIVKHAQSIGDTEVYRKFDTEGLDDASMGILQGLFESPLREDALGDIQRHVLNKIHKHTPMQHFIRMLETALSATANRRNNAPKFEWEELKCDSALG